MTIRAWWKPQDWAKRQEALVAPSILSADPLRFGEEISDVAAGGADWIHIDVMDGHFVPNLTFGLPLVTAIKKIGALPLDVHIMVDNPDVVAEQYVRAGADLVTFHVEAATHPVRIAQAIHAGGALAGVSLNPGTALESVRPLLPYVDLVLVMSVNPGYGGQSFLPESLARIKKLRSWVADASLSDKVVIEVDGGVSAGNSAALVEAGARVLVAGTAVFGEKNRARAIAALKQGK